MDPQNLTSAVDRALGEMWTKPRRLPKEPAGDQLLHYLCLEENSGELPERGRLFAKVRNCAWASMEYKERNGFGGAEDSCTRCGRIFNRRHLNVSRCPECRAGKKQAPIWGDSSGPLPCVDRGSLRTEPVSQPVRAGSDDGAIFELLAQLRCRMPEGGAQ